MRSLRDRPFELLKELDRRARAAAQGQPEAAATGAEWVGIAFRLGGEAFLLAREETREVMGYPAAVTRVPGARTWIRGLANVRGQLLPVVDLRAFLGSGNATVGRTTRVLIASHREIPAGLVVDEVMGFRRFYESEFSADLPPTLLRCERYLAGRVQAGRRGLAGVQRAHAAREPAIPAGGRLVRPSADSCTDDTGDDMINRFDAARLQPVLLGVALASALLAALALTLSGRSGTQEAQLHEHVAALSSLSQNIPLQAGAAVRGSAPAFDALAESRAQLERVLNEIDAGKSAVGMLSSPSARLLGGETGWPALLEQSQAVLDGRNAALEGAEGGRSGARPDAAGAGGRGRRRQGDGPGAQRRGQRRVRALRDQGAGRRAGPRGARRRHRAGRSRVAPAHRQSFVHGPGHGGADRRENGCRLRGCARRARRPMRRGCSRRCTAASRTRCSP